MAELDSMLVAGCLSLSTPSGSSGMWTGERRLLSRESASRKELDTASRDDCFSSGDSDEFPKDSWELFCNGTWALWEDPGLEGCLDDEIEGDWRRRVPREAGGGARYLGFWVAKPARRREPAGRKARGCVLKSDMGRNGKGGACRMINEGLAAQTMTIYCIIIVKQWLLITKKRV